MLGIALTSFITIINIFADNLLDSKREYNKDTGNSNYKVASNV